MTTDDWLDKQLFASEGIRRIELPEGRVLAQAGDAGWTLDGAATDPEAVRRYLERFERLSVLGLYRGGERTDAESAAQDEGASQDEVGSQEQAMTLGDASTVRLETVDGGQRLTFRFNEPEDEYVLTSDRYAGEFRVASYVAEQILGDLSDLLAKPDTADAAVDAEPEAEVETEDAP